ncbi:MHS family alpha-ketoglutarate permease-like MFS transporter [Microvirga flocculans]|uniref:MHS family alpha-ketoglutarate permease-like MFS transporter n=1 Tax=Microvirga flocculans TaxID=217168 RepID=A0A7W6N6C9_9HYPH|nr:MFS transporter [Microvirga flocculans]MBB4038818.1 MHS family alpha-ketoglutarate permease-like MFS transporter [Microvirga flocculans]
MTSAHILSPAVGAKTTTMDKQKSLRSLRAAAVGNMLEWFDWTLYGTFAVYLASNFFDKTNATSALLSVLAVFAVGFVARPIGGIVFGRFGDRIGRKNTLILTMSTMALASLMIALIPSYESIGIWASVLLLVARLLQGLAHGGESGVSYAYVAEISPPQHRGLWASSVFVSVTLGVMAATFLGIVLTSAFSKEEMMSYGWRIGFAVGGLLGIVAFYMRRAAHESPIYSNKSASKAEARPLTGQEKLQILLKVVFFSASSNVAYYTWVTFAPSMAISAHGMDANGAFIASLCAQIITLLLLPFFGHLADRFGRKPMVFLYGLGIMVAPFPVNAILGSEPWTLFVSQGLGLAVWALIASIYPALIAEQIPTQQRALGVGFLSSLSVAIFGGTAPYLNTWLNSIGMSWVFSVYIMVLGLLAVIAAMMIRETKGVPLSEIRGQ